MATGKRNSKKHPTGVENKPKDQVEEPVLMYGLPTTLVASASADRYISRPMELLGLVPLPKAPASLTECEFINVIREGIHKKAMDRLMEVTGMTAAEMAALVHTSDRTLRRYDERHKLSPDQSERLVELARLYAHGEQVFEDMQLFREWMGTPLAALGNQMPKTFLDTYIGIEMLQKQLLRIEHGVYS